MLAGLDGSVTWRGDQSYEPTRRSMLWNGWKPTRFPELIVTAASQQDVVAAVTFARSRGLKVAVRAGGHSWCGSPLREGGMLLVDPCRSGVHACRAQDLPYWLGLGELWEVELDDVEVDERKLVARRGRLLRPIKRWNDETRKEFVEACAERALPRVEATPDLAPFAAAAKPAATPQAAGFFSARVAEVVGGPAAYEAERRAQADWLIEALGLAA
jgi:hypothetical protein